jgi:sorting nexin-1/2
VGQDNFNSDSLFIVTSSMQVGNTADQLSVLATENAEAEAVHLEEPLEEYVRLLGSVKAALKRRQEKKSIHLNAIADLDSKQSAYNKLLGAPGKEDQATSKLVQVERCREQVEKSKAEYEDVSENLLIEFERFKLEKAEDIKQILLNYVRLQVRDTTWSSYYSVLLIFCSSCSCITD